MEFLFGEVFADATAFRGTRDERAWIREQTSFLIGWFIDAVTRRRVGLAIEHHRRAEIAVLKELALLYIIDSPALTTDSVAGLTEEMAFELHHRLTGISRGSILDAAALASR